MPNHIQNIVERINHLQIELEAALGERAEKFSYSIENRRIKFKSETLRWQKQFKQALPNYIIRASTLFRDLGDIYADFPIEEFLSFIDDAEEQLLRHEGLVGDTD